jgi:hypothetical protein
MADANNVGLDLGAFDLTKPASQHHLGHKIERRQKHNQHDPQKQERSHAQRHSGFSPSQMAASPRNTRNLRQPSATFSNPSAAFSSIPSDDVFVSAPTVRNLLLRKSEARTVAAIVDCVKKEGWRQLSE